MRKILLTIFLICLLLYGFSRPAMADSGPICPDCYYWQGYNCRYSCDQWSCQSCTGGSCQVCEGRSDLTCCNSNCCGTGLGVCLSCVPGLGCVKCGGDPYKRCCSGQCYDIRTQQCCYDRSGIGHICEGNFEQKTCCGDGSCCPVGQECCGGSCIDPATQSCCNDHPCNPANCEVCKGTPGACESRCKPENCEYCDGAGHCRSICDSDLCKTCVDGRCQTCGGNPDLTCCFPEIPGLCLPKCKINEVEPDPPCDGHTINCGGCAAGGDNCGWMGPVKVFKGGKANICNPEGCPFSHGCSHNTRVCFEVVPCTPTTWAVPLFECQEIDSSGVYSCHVTGGALDWCYPCVNDDAHKTPHPVENDTCIP